MTDYTITLSCGTESFTIHPLEFNGPNNAAVPRFIRDLSTSSGTFTLNSDLTFRFVPGFTFEVVNSFNNVNDGVYTVSTLGSTFDGVATTIHVNEAILTPLLPHGEIQYSIPVNEEATSLLLPGMGTNKYGEKINQNFVQLLENFHCDTPPVNPITGQLWYDGNLMSVYDGVEFVPITAPPNYELIVADNLCDNDFQAFIHEQTTPSDTWSVSHGLDDPIVRVFISGEEVQPADVVYPTTGQAVITFASPQEGVARFVGQENCVASTDFQAFTHEQTVPSNSWTVIHGLNFPISRVFLNNAEVQPLDITHISADETVITFSNPEVGIARFVGQQTDQITGVFVLDFDYNTPLVGKAVLQVFVDGLKKIEGVDYILTPPRTVSFLPGKVPALNANCEFYGF